MSYGHIVELMTVTPIITNLCLNEIEQRSELADHMGEHSCRTMPTSWLKPSLLEATRSSYRKETLTADHSDWSFEPGQTMDQDFGFNFDMLNGDKQ